MAYFNTAQATQEELPLYETSNLKQEAQVLEIMKQRAGLWFTPHEVHSIYRAITGKRVPVDSIKRSLTVLSNSKNRLLLKSETPCGMGIYGRRNHKWTYNRRVA